MTISHKTRPAIAARIAALHARHREIDGEVIEEQKRTWRDAAVLQRLKRRKLRLKDELARHEGLLRRLERGRAAG